MTTNEQAKMLWCPMARVAQAGDSDIKASYNRSLTKMHKPMRVAAVKDETEFELGESPTSEPYTVLVLEMSANPSSAAMCLADGCAMWRQVCDETGFCGIAGKPWGST